MTTANAARPEDEGDAPARTTACPHDGPVPHRVLIVDDDRAIRESLARALELEGYDVDVVVDGVAALARTRRETFDALIVDVMMPGVDGLGVCRVLRADGDRTPVLMLTARVETPDRVAGLDAGADDYLPKPFELDELLARNEGIALDHSTVYERIWGYDFGPDSKNLPVYIGYLRRKLAAAGAPPLIHTLRGVGYTLRKP